MKDLAVSLPGDVQGGPREVLTLIDVQAKEGGIGGGGERGLHAAPCLAKEIAASKVNVGICQVMQ